MTKRPSLLAKLQEEQPNPPEVKAVAVAERGARPQKRAPRPGVQHTSIYVPTHVYERLREIAFHERRKVHDLVMEGIDRLIESKGHPERTTDRTS